MGDIGFPLSVSVLKRERYGRRRERERERRLIVRVKSQVGRMCKSRLEA